MSTKKSDENSSVKFESLSIESQQKVLKVKKAYNLATIDEAMGMIHMIAMEKLFDMYSQQGEKHE